MQRARTAVTSVLFELQASSPHCIKYCWSLNRFPGSVPLPALERLRKPQHQNHESWTWTWTWVRLLRNGWHLCDLESLYSFITTTKHLLAIKHFLVPETPSGPQEWITDRCSSSAEITNGAAVVSRNVETLNSRSAFKAASQWLERQHLARKPLTRHFYQDKVWSNGGADIFCFNLVYNLRHIFVVLVFLCTRVPFIKNYDIWQLTLATTRSSRSCGIYKRIREEHFSHLFVNTTITTCVICGG